VTPPTPRAVASDRRARFGRGHDTEQHDVAVDAHDVDVTRTRRGVRTEHHPGGALDGRVVGDARPGSLRPHHEVAVDGNVPQYPTSGCERLLHLFRGVDRTDQKRVRDEHVWGDGWYESLGRERLAKPQGELLDRSRPCSRSELPGDATPSTDAGDSSTGSPMSWCRGGGSQVSPPRFFAAAVLTSRAPALSRAPSVGRPHGALTPPFHRRAKGGRTSGSRAFRQPSHDRHEIGLCPPPCPPYQQWFGDCIIKGGVDDGSPWIEVQGRDTVVP
jgi:hypothetical protein